MSESSQPGLLLSGSDATRTPPGPRLAQYLRWLGLEPGDRVAGFMPNMPESIIGALAAAAIGCIWSSCSPDFGVQGVLDRFGQIEPKVLLTADGYWYNGKQQNSLP